MTKAADAWATTRKAMAPWRDACDCTDKGAIRPTVHNVAHILGAHPEWQGVIAFDEFAGEVVLRGEAPIGRGERTWSNALTAELLAWLSQPDVGIDCGEGKALSAVLTAARRNAYHTLRDYLLGLRWDGTARVSALMVDYYGAEPSDYAARLGGNWLVSMVARALDPGCKVDTMPILEGRQGSYKTSSLMLLAGNEFYAEATAHVGSKDFLENLRGVWLMELAELQGLGKVDIEVLKKTLSCSKDRLRPAYGRTTETYKRTTVFVGTTNEDAYLRDPTGARRFWPIRVGRVDLDALARDRDQLWAEAVSLYQRGTGDPDPADIDARRWCWWWMPPSAVEEQADRYQADVWQALVREWVDGQAPGERYPGGERNVVYTVTGETLLAHALQVRLADMDEARTRRIGRVMRALGWTRERKRLCGQREYVYCRYPGGEYTAPQGDTETRYHHPPGMEGND